MTNRPIIFSILTIFIMFISSRSYAVDYIIKKNEKISAEIVTSINVMDSEIINGIRENDWYKIYKMFPYEEGSKDLKQALKRNCSEWHRELTSYAFRPYKRFFIQRHVSDSHAAFNFANEDGFIVFISEVKSDEIILSLSRNVERFRSAEIIALYGKKRDYWVLLNLHMGIGKIAGHTIQQWYDRFRGDSRGDWEIREIPGTQYIILDRFRGHNT